VTDRHLTRLFLQRFIENDLISPDADRLRVVSQAGAILLTGGLFVSFFLSLAYLNSPYPLPSRTAANMIRVQFLYSAWSMTVMALVAVSVWDALALDHRDTEILGPLPLPRLVIIRAKIRALVIFAMGFAAALNVVPAMIHPIVAVSRLRPGMLHIGTLVAAHIASTTAAAVFGFAAVLALRELLHAALGPAGFRRVSVVTVNTSCVTGESIPASDFINVAAPSIRRMISFGAITQSVWSSRVVFPLLESPGPRLNAEAAKDAK
jgi:hypothetical protein